MTDQERTQALFRLRHFIRADPDIAEMCKIVAPEGLPTLIEEDPDTFDVLVEEVESIVAQITTEETA